MRIYKVKEDYVLYLKSFDDKVASNKKERRPYIGIVLEINEFKYFAPLTSPKDKHKKMKNQLDFIKLDNGNLGAINLNNMIPISNVALIEYDIDKEIDISYRELLKDQLRFINSNSKNIKDKAKKLYIKVTEHNSFIKERCVNFKLLEEKSLLFDININVLEVAIDKVKGIKEIIIDAGIKAKEYNDKIKDKNKDGQDIER